MSIYDRKGLAHSRKVITSSIGTTKPRHSLETAFQSSFKETTASGGHTSPMIIIRGKLSHLNNENLRNFQDILEVKKTPTVFVSISKPSAAIDRLVIKRKTEHEKSMKNMKDELATSYAACENEFRNRSISVKIEINEIRKVIEEERDKLREINELSDSYSKDFDLAWCKVSALIEEEKKFVDHFHNSLLIIEKKRQEYSKSILKKYYKIFHKISFLLPYEIQYYMENEILNYNEAVLGNHRIYADLHLKMRLIADTEKIRFKNYIEELKIDSKEAMLDIDN